jgi:hypothetical protein
MPGLTWTTGSRGRQAEAPETARAADEDLDLFPDWQRMTPRSASRVRVLVAFAAMRDGNDPFAERHAAYAALRKWAKVHAQRDAVIRAAVAAGIDRRSIQGITGVARTTIARIVTRGA